MSLYTGVTGKLSTKIGAATATDVAHISNWTVDLSREMVESVSFGGTGYKEKVPSIKDWTASADGDADFASTSGQEALVEAYENGTPVEASFYLDTTTFFKGSAYIESLSISHAADGKAEISISLSGSGGIVLTVPA